MPRKGKGRPGMAYQLPLPPCSLGQGSVEANPTGSLPIMGDEWGLSPHARTGTGYEWGKSVPRAC